MFIDDFMQKVADAKTVYFLEYFDDRALCSELLKNGKSNNIAVISRGDYGVDEQKNKIEEVIKVLMEGETPFSDTVYVTRKEELAKKIEENIEFSMLKSGDYYILRNNL